MSARDTRDAPPRVDLIVLAGGRGSRLGGALKPAVEVAGRTLLSRVLDARTLVRRTVVVGPDSARPAVGPAVGPGVGPAAGSTAGTDASALLWALEDPPFGGPVAGIAAGLAALADADLPGAAPLADSDWILLLACDLPRAAEAARLLVAAVPGLPITADGAHLVDGEGRAQWLTGIYRTSAVRAAVHRIGPAARDASVRNLLGDLTLTGIRDETGAGRDVDTWQDVSETTALLTGDSANDPHGPTTPSRSDTE